MLSRGVEMRRNPSSELGSEGAESRPKGEKSLWTGNIRLGHGARGSSPLVSAHPCGSGCAHTVVLCTPAPHGLRASVRQNKLHVSSNRYTFDLRPVRSGYGSSTLSIFRKMALLGCHAPRELGNRASVLMWPV